MFLLFDIGGTKMRLARSLDGVSFDAPVVLETPRKYEEGIELFVQTARELGGDGSFRTIAGGIAGPFSQENCSLLTSPNLGGWVGKPLCADIEKALGAKVSVENDSALVGLGEATAGVGWGMDRNSGSSSIIAYLTVSTGVGGARIVDGRIDKTTVGFEPGHQIIDADRSIIPDADGIYLGNYISGKGIENRTGKKAYEIDEPTLWSETLPRLLAYGLNNVAVLWSPDVIVLGGSMIVGTKGPTIDLLATEQYLKEILKIFPEIPQIKRAELGDFGGLHGALELIRQHA